MKSNFDRCLAEVLKHEGGYVDHPSDPGGETNMGISRRSYPNENIKGMTRERAAFLYRRDFWNPVRGDDLPAGLDLVAFDAAVNSGVSRGAKWVQRALGVPDDGKIGPATIAAAKKADVPAVIEKALANRLGFLMALKTWPTFGRGWKRRLDEVHGAAIKMAAKPPVPAKKPGLLEAFFAAIMALFKGKG